MEKLLYSIPKDKWDDFIAGSAKIQKIWLKEHLLLDSTDFFSALVLSKVQSLPVTEKDVKAIVGSRLPEALAKVLGSTEIFDLESIKKFNKLVIREVTSKIQSSTNQDSMKKKSLVRRSMDKLFRAVHQIRLQGHQTAVDNGTKAKIHKQENVPSTNAAPHTLRAPKRKAKGAHTIYNKYRGGKQWLKEGVPKLPTIPEATQMEEMLAEIDHFGYTIQTYNEVNIHDLETQQSAKVCNILKPESPPLEVNHKPTIHNERSSKPSLDNNKKVHSLIHSDVEKQPSREEFKGLKASSPLEPKVVESGNFQACDLSESPTAKNSSQNPSLEEEHGKEYVGMIIEMLLVQALEVSYLSCSCKVFDDLYEYIFEKVWTEVKGQTIIIRSEHLDRFVNSIFSKICEEIFCKKKRALSLFVMRAPELEEVYLAILKKNQLKKVGNRERFFNFMYDMYDKMNNAWGKQPQSSCDQDSYTQKASMVEPGDTHVNKVGFLQESSEEAQIMSSTPSREPPHFPDTTTVEKPTSCPGSAKSSEKRRKSWKRAWNENGHTDIS